MSYNERTIYKPPFIIYLSLFFLLICVYSLGAKYFVFSYPIVLGVSSFYLVVALMVVCALWFGVWGVLASYVGCVIGAGLLSGLPPDVSLYWSFADLWEALIPFLAFWKLNGDPSLGTRRDILIFLGFGVILNNLVGAIWGSWTLAIGGVISEGQIIETMTGWFFVNVVVCVLLCPILLVLISPWMKTLELYQGTYP